MIRATITRLGLAGRAAAGLLLSAAVVCGMLIGGGVMPAHTAAAYHDHAYMNLSMKVAEKRTAVVTGRVEAQYGTTPTGTATLVRGTATLATATLDGGAYRFTFDVPMTWSGDVEVEVVYGGDANHEPSRSTVVVALGD